MRLIILSGLSGAGKTVALRQYEDLGYYCIDNLPLDLVQPLIQHASERQDARYQKLALGLDSRSHLREIEEFPAFVDRLRAQDIDVQVWFLTADEHALIRRYSETRRKHPLSSGEMSLVEAIRHERNLLAPIASNAHVVFDTSTMNLHELRETIHLHLPEAGQGKLSVQFLSFGFKNGLPDGVDFVFDVRALPNPHWQPELRPLTGQDEPVARYLQRQPEVVAMLRDLRHFLETWLPPIQAQDRAYVTVAIGCTGGQHRSVYMVEKLSKFFRGRFDAVMTKHRDLPRPRL